MVKIKKTPTERHNATAPPAITSFVKEATSVPLHQLSPKLSEFPTHWPLPRGDLYHWIPLLDRFDDVLERFVQEYDLKSGPQTQPFTRRLLEKGDGVEQTQPTTAAELDKLGYGDDGDRHMVEQILRFTKVLHERCGNRSLYASSGHLNDVLNTSSLSLLRACLHLTLRLAQRYQVAKYKSASHQPGLMASHYNISFDRLEAIAKSFNIPRSVAPQIPQSVSRSKDKSATVTSYNPADLVAIARNDFSDAVRSELATVDFVYQDQKPAVETSTTADGPATPTPAHRQSPRPGVNRTSSNMSAASKSRDSYFPTDHSKTHQVDKDELMSTPAWELTKNACDVIPSQGLRDFTHRVLVAKALGSSNKTDIELMLDNRLLAIANLAYAAGESRFQEKIGSPDSNEPRRYHLASQLCDLLQPTQNGLHLLPLKSITVVLETLESLARSKHKSMEVVDALAVTVNHGVLYYELRQAVATLHIDASPEDPAEAERIQWRHAIFDLVTTISQINSHVKCAEKMVAAGIMEILVEVLSLRTSSAERVYEKIMGFLSSFIHGITSAFTALASARGLEIITELASYEVTLAMRRVREGQGMPEQFKSKIVDYSIPYYQQATLRSVFKFVVYLFDHNSGVHDRLLRNLLDSPQTLGALREIIGNAHIFGSNVWDAAINTVSNFIHNEPTSFAVIAEAGLAKGILEAVTRRVIPELSTGQHEHSVNDIESSAAMDQAQAPQTGESSHGFADIKIEVIDGVVQFPTAAGILPVNETICDLPTAFGAICLNEDGMNMFLASGVLHAYLDIFLSPAHVRALEDEGQTAFSIGNAFDELARHHPGLQDQIQAAVSRLIRGLHSLVTLPEMNASAQLTRPEDWKNTDLQTALSNRAPAITFLSAFFKFLDGFFHNSNMCQRFASEGAAGLILDVICSGANPYDLNYFPVVSKMAAVMCRLYEDRPHLVLPYLLDRTCTTLDGLDDFISHQSDKTFFHDFVNAGTIASADYGSQALSRLCTLSTLCVVLNRVLHTASFTSRDRAQNQLLTTMNFTDVYIKLIQSLGKLHSVCLQQCIALYYTIPQPWLPFSSAESTSVRNVNEDGVVHTTSNCAHCSFQGSSDAEAFFSTFEEGSKPAKIALFRNTRLLRFVLAQVPLSIQQVFSAFSNILAPKRQADSFQKRYAAILGETMADAMVSWYDVSSLSGEPGADVRYWSATLSSHAKIFFKQTMSIETFTAREACTLVLSKFHTAGGFEKLAGIQQRLVDMLSPVDGNEADASAGNAITSSAQETLKALLVFFQAACNSKSVIDAAQSQLITVKNHDQPDFFLPQQFLVEVRNSVIKSVSELWSSDKLADVGETNIKVVIDILREILRADSEEKALKRSDAATRRAAVPLSTIEARPLTNIGRVESEVSTDLAEEAVLRCFDHETRAVEYAELRARGSPCFPVSDLQPYLGQRRSQGREQGDEREDEQMSDDEENYGTLGRLPDDMATQDFSELRGAMDFPISMLRQPTKAKDTKEAFVTVDDLNEKREVLREELIDRCLEVLSTQPGITFELAHLIQAAVAKTGEGANPRAEWGTTLISSLLSLQGEEGNDAIGKKIAAYAHLVALVLQDRDFFDSTIEELKDNLEALLNWLPLSADQNAESAPWLEMILLIVEQLLAEDEKPVEVVWTPPPEDNPYKAMPETVASEPVVSDDLRQTLFTSVVNILPKIGSNQSLALSVCRILVILTRRQNLARQLSERLNMTRLFMMIRQLASQVPEKLQSAFMIILRHIVEDDASVLQTMKIEIRTALESSPRAGRGGMDTTMYVRNLHHLVIRNPALFVQATKEIIEIVNFGSPTRPQTLALKKDIDSLMQGPKENTEVSAVQQSEYKPPAVEPTDGVMQFLLRELSNFKDVEEKPVAKLDAEFKIEGAAEDTSTDAQESNDKADNKTFEPKEHVIFIYRCFLLHCLTELLGSYQRTKLEFINFSRKTDSQISTPSKPRSGTINYLLNQLLPVMTIEYRSTIEQKKIHATSNWASSVLTALCTQPHESTYAVPADDSTDRSRSEHPDLAFVRRFVLEHAIRSFKDALSSSETQDMRYSRLLSLADLFERMLTVKTHSPNSGVARQARQIGRQMYEKNFIGVLTSAIADLDLNFANAKRVVKHILVPLKALTDLAVDLSQEGEITSSDPSSGVEEDDVSSATSISDDESADGEREQTPDLFRNSTLSMFEGGGQRDDDSTSESEAEEDDEDEEMYEGGFDEEMEYDDGNGETISDDEDDEDEDEEIEGMDDMGDIEGVPGDMHMEIEVIEEESGDSDDEDHSDEHESSEEDDDDDDDHDHDAHDDFYDEMEEVNGDDENASLADEHEGEWDQEGDFAQDDEHHIGSPEGDALDHIAQIIGADEHSDGEGHNAFVSVVQAGDDEFFEDEMAPGDDEGDDGEEEHYGDEFGFEPEVEEDEDESGGWGLDFAQAHNHLSRHSRRHRHTFEEVMIGGNHGERWGILPRHHRHHHQPRAEDEGTNPLLQRSESINFGGNRPESMPMMPPFRSMFSGIGPRDTMMQSIFSALGQDGALRMPGGPFTVTMHGRPTELEHHMRELMRLEAATSSRDRRMPFIPFGQQSGPSSWDAELAISLKPASTITRWAEEARLLFSIKATDKAMIIVNSLFAVLVPPAMEAKRIRDKEEAERKEAEEEKAREEARQAEIAAKEAREKKEREEAEEARVAAEAAAQAALDAQAQDGGDTRMSDAAEPAVQPETPAEPEVPRIFATIRGRDIDITNLGIDHEYLAALPEELREEVIMSQVQEQRSQAQQTGEPPSEISQEFLNALPPEIQAELLRQDAADRRRREREARRSAANNGQGPPPPPHGQDMEAVDFLAMLEPQLRDQILTDAHEDEGYLATLPEEIQREARALLQQRRPHHVAPRIVQIVNNRASNNEAPAEKIRSRPVVQMLDKAGVATLLRLMFITLQQGAKGSLRGILSDVCKNTQNRAEVISILLSILQDGTADVNAVERSFAQLSLRAKQSSGPKTPQPLKRSLTGQLVQPMTELSPISIVQQCLSTLNALSNDNPKVQTFFLSEHETLASQKAKANKKPKAKEATASKYPLNALLTLLDRKLITENTSVMETLAALLSRVTQPLQILAKRAKQAQESSEQAEELPAPPADPMEISVADLRAEAQAVSEAPATEKKKRSSRELEAPSVPEENIRLVVNILAARECPSKTFSDTLDIIKHMAAIPGAKEVFGRELIRQASELGGDVGADLENLTEQISNAQKGADIQAVALANFSSAGSKQRKLLRILVALDHLFDAKRMAAAQSSNVSADVKLKEDILAALYDSDTFQSLWQNLSQCLTAIRMQGDLVNVATVLLPLVESLMVVCRNSALQDSPTGASQAEVAVSTPPPQTRMEGLFFSFTEEHRKILNELIRNNPKLMNGNLSVLAKNSKVLEFDNKRSYFNRKLHNRGAERGQHAPLTLNVRRDSVFLDSYKALYFKSGEEIKNGKLNIRFNGEEGVDAGGVSREWFSVMARQMFNPDFALFNPVASDRTTFHPNRLSDINEEHLSFFKFIGRVIGKALYEGRVLDCHFSRAVYRRILGKSVSLKDMESLDLDYYKSLVWILENDITDITFETFSVEVDRFGEIEIVDLVPDGRNIAVTEDNKQEYVRLVVEHRLINSVEDQLKNFLQGFHDIIPAELISIFNEQELELLISGLPDIDVDDWKNNTEYHNYQATSAQIQWFWRAVKSFDPEERAKLLQFVTGTSKVPLNGFKELEGMNGFARFNIHRDYSSKEKLPTSHTCFNQLDLPEYDSYEHLRQQLYTAITAGSEYFGFA